MSEKLSFAKNLALEAGEVMRNNFTLGMKKEWKSDTTPLTVTDTTINRMVIEKVKDKYPNEDVKGEEESSLENQSKSLWVCDPVDGTIAFAHGLPISTFSLAFVEDGESRIGVVYDPFMDRLFYAEKGKGAFLNDEAIHVSGNESLVQSAMAIENFVRAPYDLMEAERALTENDVKLMKLCSIIYPTALVAKGEFVATIFPHSTAHDAAAIKVIVEEAGGKVTDLFGNEQRYDQPINGFIASNGRIHDKLVEIIKTSLKKRS
jgi:fructose-1,6-bisphosphatase/inositol monophosphatase family enzyme